MKSFIKNTGLLFTSLIITLLLSEGIVRLFVVQETKRLATYDRELGWRGKPNGEGIFIRNRDNIHVPFKFNHLGFRDENYEKKLSGTVRIAILGDSFVESLEVDYEKTFHRLLENRLQNTVSDSIEVPILASQGYSTAQELLALRKFKDIVQPDIVLLAFYTGNDFENNVRKKFAYLDKTGDLQFRENKDSWFQELNLTFQRWLYEHSHLVFFLKNLIQSRTQIKLADNARALEKRSDDYKYKITDALIQETAAEANRLNAKFGVVIFPARGEVRRNEPGKPNKIISFCQAANIPYLNFFPLLSAENYFKTDIHFNQKGHQLVANGLFDFLIKNFTFPGNKAAPIEPGINISEDK